MKLGHLSAKDLDGLFLISLLIANCLSRAIGGVYQVSIIRFVSVKVLVDAVNKASSPNFEFRVFSLPPLLSGLHLGPPVPLRVGAAGHHARAPQRVLPHQLGLRGQRPLTQTRLVSHRQRRHRGSGGRISWKHRLPHWCLSQDASENESQEEGPHSHRPTAGLVPRQVPIRGRASRGQVR